MRTKIFIFRFMAIVAIVLSVFLGSCKNKDEKVTPSTSVNSVWVGIDMGAGGYLNNVEAGPTGIILCNSDLSGTYISQDHGRTWSCIGSVQGLQETHTCGLGFDPVDPNVMFIGSDNGLYRSQNGGASFTKVMAGRFWTDIQFSKSNHQIGYATSTSLHNKADARVYKTTDNGLTWMQVSTDLPTNSIMIQAMIINPQDPNIIYAHSDAGRFVTATQALYKSINGGVNWTEVAAGTLHGKIYDIAIDPNNFQKLYASGSGLGGVIKSTDGGISWSTPTTTVVGSLHIKSGSTTTLRLLSNWKCLESTDDGNSWTTTSNWNTYMFLPGNAFGGASARKCDDMSNGDTYFWRNSAWLWGSGDGGKTIVQLWTNELPKGSGNWRTRGLKNTNPWDLAISEADPNVIYAAFWDMGLWRSLDHGATWQSCNYIPFTGAWTSSVDGISNQGCGGNSKTVVADPTRANVVWATIGGDQHETEYVCKSTNSGKFDSWVKSTGLPATYQIWGLSVDYNSSPSNRTLFVTADGNIYKSMDDGATWVQKTSTFNVQYTLVDRFDLNYAYAGGTSGFYRTTDGGNSWTKMGLSEMTSIYDIKADPSNAGWIYAACFGVNKGLYLSKDKGTSWRKILTDNFLRGVAVDPKNPKNLYAASSSAMDSGGYDSNSHGILVSRDGGVQWTSANQGLSWPFAWCIEVDPKDPSYVFAGINGSGFQMRKF